MAAPDDLLIDRVYEASFLPERWSEALDGLCAVAGCDQGLIFAAERDAVGGYIATPSMAATFQVYFEENWNARDVVTARAVSLRPREFVATHDMFTAEDFEATDYCNDFSRRTGMGAAVGTLVAAPDDAIITFGLHKPWTRERFAPDVYNRLNALRAHLARAALTASRLKLEQARIALEALKALRLPACAFSFEGRYRLGNSLFEALMPHLAQDRRERLMFSDPAADAMLASALVDLRNAPSSARGRTFPLKGRAGEAPSIVHVVPVCGESRDVFSQTQGLVIIVPVALSDAVDTRLIEGLFDLTPAEAAIAGGLLRGMTLDSIASERGTSLQTTRTQLKAVMQKTGTNRQADLVRLLSATRLGTGEP